MCFLLIKFQVAEEHENPVVLHIDLDHKPMSAFKRPWTLCASKILLLLSVDELKGILVLNRCILPEAADGILYYLSNVLLPVLDWLFSYCFLAIQYKLGFLFLAGFSKTRFFPQKTRWAGFY